MTKGTVAKARLLRRTMSQPEARLWQVLRARPAGLKFRRQHPIGPYVLDFYCPSARVGIELDGVSHDMGGNPARDEGRDRWLEERGFTVLRIPAAELYGDIEPAIRLILARCGAEGSSTGPRVCWSEIVSPGHDLGLPGAVQSSNTLPTASPQGGL